METRSESPWIFISAIILIVFSTVGPALPSLHIREITIFPFRIVFPIFVAIYIIRIYIKSDKLIISRTLIPFLGFVFLGIVTIVANPDIVSYRDFIIILKNIILFLSISFIMSNRYWLYQSWMVMSVLLISALVFASVEVAIGWHMSFSQVYNLPDVPPVNTWATAWYYGTNHLSVFFSIASIYCFVMAIRPNISIYNRIGYIIPWASSLIFNYLLDARAGILAMVIVSISGLILTYHRPVLRYLVTDLDRVVGTLSVIIVFILVYLFAHMPNPFETIGSSLWTRWQLQKAAIVGGGLFGNGFGSSAAVMRSVEVAIAGKSDPHSWFGVILTDTGMIGLILFIMFYVFLIMKCVKISLNRDPINITCTIVLLALPVAALGPGNAILFRDYWIFLSLSYSCYRLNHISDTNIGSSRLYYITW